MSGIVLFPTQGGASVGFPGAHTAACVTFLRLRDPGVTVTAHLTGFVHSSGKISTGGGGGAGAEAPGTGGGSLLTPHRALRWLGPEEHFHRQHYIRGSPGDRGNDSTVAAGATGRGEGGSLPAGCGSRAVGTQAKPAASRKLLRSARSPEVVYSEKGRAGRRAGALGLLQQVQGRARRPLRGWRGDGAAALRRRVPGAGSPPRPRGGGRAK